MGSSTTTNQTEIIRTWSKRIGVIDRSVFGMFPVALRLVSSVAIVCALALVCASVAHVGPAMIAIIDSVAILFVLLMVSTRRLLQEATIAALSHEASAQEVEVIRRRLRDVEAHLAPDTRAVCREIAGSLPLPAASISRQAISAPDSLMILIALGAIATIGAAMVPVSLASEFAQMLPREAGMISVCGALGGMSIGALVVARIIPAAMRDAAGFARKEILNARSLAYTVEGAAGIVDARPPFRACG
jgi:hypothetical protein